MRPAFWDLIWIAVVVLLAAVPFGLMVVDDSPTSTPDTITLSELAAGIHQSSVASIELEGSEGVATDILGVPHVFEVGPRTNLLHALNALGVSADELATVTYSVKDPPAAIVWWNILLGLAPMIVFGMLVLFAWTRAGESNHQQLLRLTKHHARRFIASQQSIGFKDVAGVDEAKRELAEVVQFLTTPERFAYVGAQCPRGVLLVGEPGTGKTLLARAVAGEARVPFFSICGSEFVEIVAGVGASRVRDLFDHARRIAPCLLFVDEIDAIGRSRGLGVSAGTSEGEQALNQLLVEMDGFDSSTNVIVIAATNRVDTLDPALLRPGRFDRHVVVTLPDRAGREAILEVHARGKPLEASVDLAMLARITTGLSGADLAQIMNESAILAARRGKRALGMSEVHGALERLLLGQEVQSRVVPESARRRRAYQQAGRALIIRFLQHHARVTRVTIVPHSQADSFTHCVDDEEHQFQTYGQLQDRLTAALAGRAAERLAFPELASGDEADITAATDVAEAMVKRYGMSRRVGLVALSSEGLRSYSESTARLIDDETRALIDQAYGVAAGTLGTHRAALDRLADALLEHETLEGEALEQFLAEPVQPPSGIC